MSMTDYFLNEDFNDGVLNGEPWTYRNDVEETSGYLLLTMSATDQRANAIVTFPESLFEASINYDLFMHSTGSNFLGENRMYFTTADGEFIEVRFYTSSSTHGPDYGYDPNNYDLPKLSIFYPDGSRDDIYSTGANTSTFFDTWTEVTINFDSSSGSISVDMESDGLVDISFSNTELVGATLDQYTLGTYGWYTGHYSRVDNFSVEGSTQPSQNTLVFFDSFDRSDSETVGNGWVELHETQPSDTAFGSSTLSISGGYLAFSYDAEGNLPLPSDLLQPYMTHELPTDLGETGFEIQFTFTPGDDERVSHFVGVADSSSGQYLAEVIGPTFYIPGSGFGIELYRSDDTTLNSGFTLYRFDEDHNFEFDNFLSQEIVLTREFTSFQFEQEDQIDVSFQVTTEGAWTVNISNGAITDTFTGATDELTEAFDQVVMSSIYAGLYGIDGSIFYDANQTEIVRIDDLAVYALGDAEPPEPEVDTFDFNVYTAMQLSRASYILANDRATEGPFIQKFEDLQIDLRDELSDLEASYADFDLVCDLNVAGRTITDDSGLYIRDNAAALLATSEDALIIAFRGTNDNVASFTETAANILDALTVNTKNKLVEVGARAALNGLTKALGVSTSTNVVDVVSDVVSDIIVPQEYNSDDVAHWLNLNAHWALFEDLVGSLPSIMDTLGLSKIFVTGHSLGGGMVQEFVANFPEEETEYTIKAYAFAPPGHDAGGPTPIGVTNNYDARLLNVFFENDPLLSVNSLTDSIGETLILDANGTGSHDTADYLDAARALVEAGLRTGDRLDDPNNPGNEIGPQISRLSMDLDSNGRDVFVDPASAKAVVGTDFDDNIDVGSGLFLRDGFIVAGLKGNDSFDLSNGADYFVFREGDGRDTIENFNIAEDTLVLYEFDTPIDPQIIEINGSLPFTYDTTVNFGNGDSITFNGLDFEEVEFLLDNSTLPDGAFDPLLLA